MWLSKIEEKLSNKNLKDTNFFFKKIQDYNRKDIISLWRLNKWKFQQIQKWDILEMDWWEKFVVEYKDYYSSFREMLEQKGLERVLPDIKTIKDGVNVYYKFYTIEQEEKYWIVALSISLL